MQTTNFTNKIKRKLLDIKKIIFGLNGYEFTSHPYKIAPVLVAVRGIIKNNQGQYLFVQRSKDDRKDPSLWEFPGGKIDRGEYDPMHTLTDEISQETGLKVKIYDETPFFITSKAIDINKTYKDFLMINLYYKCQALTEDVTISFEHQNYKWAKPIEIKDQVVLTDSTLGILNSKFIDNF